jgi:hypothetical protein
MTQLNAALDCIHHTLLDLLIDKQLRAHLESAKSGM